MEVTLCKARDVGLAKTGEVLENLKFIILEFTRFSFYILFQLSRISSGWEKFLQAVAFSLVSKSLMKLGSQSSRNEGDTLYKLGRNRKITLNILIEIKIVRKIAENRFATSSFSSCYTHNARATTFSRRKKNESPNKKWEEREREKEIDNNYATLSFPSLWQILSDS